MTENYKLVRLGEICEISTGSTDTKDATENGQYPLFDRSKKIKTSDKYLFDCEALIMPGEGAEFLPRHYIGKFDLHQRAYAMFNFSGLVNPKYLHFYLIAVKDYFANNAVGATVKSLRRRHFTDLEVPLPSLEKQAETVEKLDSTFADIDLLEGNLELSDEKASQLLQSILSSAFAPVDESNLSANQGIAMTQIFRLDKIAEVGSGNSAPQKEELFKGGTLPFVRTSDVGTIHIGSIESSRDLLTPEGVKGLKLQPAGTILFPKSGASTFLNHRVLLSKNAYVSSHLATIKANNELAIDRYLFYFLQTIDARNLCQDQAYPSLNRDQIGGIEVPVPSLEKQHETVKKLDSAFADIDLLEENLDRRISATEKLQDSLLASFFDLNEEEVGEDYSFHSLGSVSLVKGGKRLPKGTKWSPVTTKYPYIRVTDIKFGRINADNLVFVPDEIRPLIKNYIVGAGDIIISIAGTIGEIAVVPESLDKASLTENAAKIVLQRDKVNVDYCSYFLRSPVCRRMIESLVRTTTQPKLALFRIESLRIPIPSIERQRKIVNILNSGLSEIELLRSRFNTERQMIISLRQSLLSSAFTQEEAVA